MVSRDHRESPTREVKAAMNPPVVPRLIVVASALATLAGPAAHAQEPPRSAAPGRVQGIVFDSTRGEPLPDAAVFLWGTSYRGVSDLDGNFLIEGVAPGQYSLVFFHSRLGELGISPGPQQISVAPGAAVVANLGTPSWFTVMVSQCLLEERAAGRGFVAGWVGDGSSGMGLPNAKVTLSWPVEGSREPRRQELETDATGWYRMCDAPAAVPISASARFLNLQGLRREVVVADGGASQATFLLWELQPAKVAGAVHDATSGLGVEGAEVWLRGTSLRAVTGRDGAFRFGEVPPGTYTILSEHLLYGTRQDTLVIPSGSTLDVDLRIDTRAIELDPVIVTVESVPLTQRSMGGLTVGRDQIEKVEARSRDAADVIQALNLPGVIVRRRADGSLCVGYGPGQAHMAAFGGCVSMEIYINEVHATSADMALHIPPDAVERIVLFRPVEAANLFPINAANGVIVIYTRR